MRQRLLCSVAGVQYPNNKKVSGRDKVVRNAAWTKMQNISSNCGTEYILGASPTSTAKYNGGPRRGRAWTSYGHGMAKRSVQCIRLTSKINGLCT